MSQKFAPTMTGEVASEKSETFYVTLIYAKMLKMAQTLIVHEVFRD